MIYFAGLPEGRLIRDEIPSFTQQTGIEVDFQEVAYNAIRERQVSSIQARLGAFDVIFVDDIWLYEYARGGLLRPLDDYADRYRDEVDLGDFYPKVMEAEGTLDGRLWLMPQRADVQVLFYRRDLFEDPRHQAGFQQRFGSALQVPDTWAQYADVAKYFTDSLQPAIYGAGETLQRPHFAFEFFAMRYWAWSGNNFFDDAARPVFSSAAGVAALESLVHLRPFVAPGSSSWAHDQTISAFAQGRLAMAPQWYAFDTDLRSPSSSSVAANVGVALVPGVRLQNGDLRRAPSLGGGSLGIPVDSPQPERAWAFIRHMTGKDFMARAARRGAIVPRRSAYLDADMRKSQPAIDVYLESLERAWFRPRLANFAEVEAIVGRAVSRAFVGEVTASSALAEAEVAVRNPK